MEIIQLVLSIILEVHEVIQHEIFWSNFLKEEYWEYKTLITSAVSLVYILSVLFFLESILEKFFKVVRRFFNVTSRFKGFLISQKNKD